jgi:hypothetical protein
MPRNSATGVRITLRAKPIVGAPPLKGFAEICNDLGQLPADPVDIHAFS